MLKPLANEAVVEYEKERMVGGILVPENAEEGAFIRVKIITLPEKKESMTASMMEMLDELNQVQKDGKKIIIKRRKSDEIDFLQGKNYYFIGIEDVYAVEE